MKTRADHLKIVEKAITEESDPDCSCELLDTSLSGVGDSDCSCSECLQANLEAFNELKQYEEQIERQNDNRLTRRGSSRVGSNRQTRQIDRNTSNLNQKTRVKINDYKSVDKMRETTKNHQNINAVSTSNLHQEIEGPEAPTFSHECINDYIKITQYRARQYLNQMKQLKKSQIQERQRLKDMIKENLQGLKFTVREKNQEDRVLRERGFEPSHKWNHQPYHCKTKAECRKMIPYNPDLENKKEEIDQIKKRIKDYKQKTQNQSYECPDRCPNHHMRTSQKKLAEIKKFIEKKAKNYEEMKKKEKEESEKQKRVKEAKLRAIQIRCKNIVAKSKKYDPDISRTSFHNSIDHFSTFSDLRMFNLEKLKEKEKRMKVKKAMKQGGYLEEQIYQNISENLIGDHPPIHSKLEAESRYEERHNDESEQFCEKIIKEAMITECKKGQPSKPNPRRQDKKSNLQKEEKRKKQLQKEIDKKKEEIFKEYQKRNEALGQKFGDSRSKK